MKIFHVLDISDGMGIIKNSLLAIGSSVIGQECGSGYQSVLGKAKKL